MGMIGCLGEIVFTVSDTTILTLDNMKWSGSARYTTHQRHLTNALTEFTGVDPDKISFEIIFSAALGIDPLAEIVKLWAYERSGQAVPLTVGEKGYGKYRWNVVSHEEQMVSYDKDGNVMTAKVSINLQEYVRV